MNRAREINRVTAELNRNYKIFYDETHRVDDNLKTERLSDIKRTIAEYEKKLNSLQ